jgi:hypothetical protein
VSKSIVNLRFPRTPACRAEPGNLKSKTSLGLWVLLAYGVLACIATHPLWQRLASAVPSDIGDPLLNTWIVSWDAHALLTRPLHLFDANIFFPLPGVLAYSEHLLGTSIISLPVLLLSNQPVIAYNLAFWLSYALGGWGAYLLVRHYTRHSWAAFLAGLAFAYAPYRLTAFSHLQLLTLQWLPFALICLEAAWSTTGRRSARHWFAFGSLLWLQVATSWHLAVFAALTVTAFWVSAWVRLPTRLPWRRRGPILGTALSLLAVTALTWPLIPPYLAVVSQLRESRPIDLAAQFSARLGDYLAAPPANPIYGGLTATLSGRAGFTEENFLFVGVVGPLVALAGLVWAWRRRGRVRVIALTCAVVALAAWVLTWGPYLQSGGARLPLPYLVLAQLSPIFALIRVPPRWMAAANLPLAVLTGFGAAAILRSRALQDSRPLSFGLTGILAVALLAEGWGAPLPLAEVGATGNLPAAYRWLAAQPGDFGVMEWPLYVAPRPEYPETRRLYASTIHWKRLVNGYSGMTPARQTALDAALRGFPDDAALEALRDLARKGVRYMVVHSGEQSVDRARWDGIDRWRLARSTTTRPVFEAQGDFIYELSPWGDAMLASPDAVLPANLRPVDARWQGGIALLAYETHLEAGAPYVDLFWRADARPARDATVFVHLLDASGAIAAQGDGPPVGGHYGTAEWAPSEIIRDRHVLVRATGASTGPGTLNGAQLRIGLYYPETEARVPVVDRAGQPTGDFILLPASTPSGIK